MTKKRTSPLKRLLALSLSALLALSMIVTAFATGVTTTANLPTSLSSAKTTSLKVSYNGDDKTDIKVQAFRVLQKVYKDGTQTTGDPDNTVENNDNSLYVVTEPFAQFFNTAYDTYMSSNTYKDASTLYLVYDAMNNHHYLNLQTNNHVDGSESKDVLAQDKYITISQTNAASTATTGKLDTDPLYFAASLIAKIAGDSTTGATGSASDIAKLSNWLSVYVQHVNADPDNPTVDFDSVKTDKKNFTGDTVTFEDVLYGYYVVLASREASSGTNTSDTSRTYISHSILNVADGSNTIALKADKISLSKEIIKVGDVNVTSDKNNATANVGQTLTYQVKSKTPEYTSYDLDEITRYDFSDTVLDDSKQVKTSDKGVASDNYGKYRYVFRDTMTNQSFVESSVKIQIDGVEDTAITYSSGMFKVTKTNGDTSIAYDLARLELTNYERSDASGVVQGTQTMYLVFNMKTIKNLGLDTKEITLTYETVLEKEAMTNKNTNKIELIYSNDPYNMANKENWLPPSTVTKIHTYGLDVTKKFADGDTKDDTYQQVTFKLYEGDSASGNALWFIRDKQTGEYMLCRGQNDSYDSTKQEAPTRELKLILNDTNSSNAGKLLIQGLGKKTYTLVETAAPGGYPSGKTATITYKAKDGDAKALEEIKTGGCSVTGTNVMSGNIELANEVTTGNHYSIAFYFLNKKGFKLPTTGDTGTIVFAVAGVVLACAGVLMLKKDKKKQ